MTAFSFQLTRPRFHRPISNSKSRWMIELSRPRSDPVEGPDGQIQIPFINIPPPPHPTPPHPWRSLESLQKVCLRRLWLTSPPPTHTPTGCSKITPFPYGFMVFSRNSIFQYKTIILEWSFFPETYKPTLYIYIMYSEVFWISQNHFYSRREVRHHQSIAILWPRCRVIIVHLLRCSFNGLTWCMQCQRLDCLVCPE